MMAYAAFGLVGLALLGSSPAPSSPCRRTTWPSATTFGTPSRSARAPASCSRPLRPGASSPSVRPPWRCAPCRAAPAAPTDARHRPTIPASPPTCSPCASTTPRRGRRPGRARAGRGARAQLARAEAPLLELLDEARARRPAVRPAARGLCSTAASPTSTSTRRAAAAAAPSAAMDGADHRWRSSALPRVRDAGHDQGGSPATSWPESIPTMAAAPISRRGSTGARLPARRRRKSGGGGDRRRVRRVLGGRV